MSLIHIFIYFISLFLIFISFILQIYFTRIVIVGQSIKHLWLDTFNQLNPPTNNQLQVQHGKRIHVIRHLMTDLLTDQNNNYNHLLTFYQHYLFFLFIDLPKLYTNHHDSCVYYQIYKT